MVAICLFWCGNLTLKVDIKKAFYCLNWNFLLKVLHKFGFNKKFCSWIINILHLAFLSINTNGVLHGFFSCTHGVQQGGPLSSLVFYLVEDVMRKRILQLVSTCKLDLIVGPKNVMVPSHILYANDVLIFYKCKISNIKNLISLFKDRAAIFGQVVNCGKSFIYSGSMLSSSLNILVNLSEFQKSSTPFIYFGVPVFKHKPKRAILDKVEL